MCEHIRERGSAQRLKITRIKRDINDPTIGLSIIVVKGLNADFDGDQVSVTLNVDNFLDKELLALAPHKSTFSVTRPREVSGNLAIPKPVASTISHFIHHTNDERMNDIVKLNATQALAEAF